MREGEMDPRRGEGLGGVLFGVGEMMVEEKADDAGVASEAASDGGGGERDPLCCWVCNGDGEA
jgi:hypothetical protein